MDAKHAIEAVLGKLDRPKSLCDILDPQLNCLLVLLMDLENFDEEIKAAEVLNLLNLLSRLEHGDVDDHVITEVSDGPLTEHLEGLLVLVSL